MSKICNINQQIYQKQSYDRNPKTGILIIKESIFNIFKYGKKLHTLQLPTSSVYELQYSRIKSATTPQFSTFFLFCKKRGVAQVLHCIASLHVRVCTYQYQYSLSAYCVRVQCTYTCRNINRACIKCKVYILCFYPKFNSSLLAPPPFLPIFIPPSHSIPPQAPTPFPAPFHSHLSSNFRSPHTSLHDFISPPIQLPRQVPIIFPANITLFFLFIFEHLKFRKKTKTFKPFSFLPSPLS